MMSADLQIQALELLAQNLDADLKKAYANSDRQSDRNAFLVSALCTALYKHVGLETLLTVAADIDARLGESLHDMAYHTDWRLKLAEWEGRVPA